MNNSYQKKPYTPHVHWHFRPRYEQPVTINNVTFEDPEFGFHYDRDQHNEVDAKTLKLFLINSKRNSSSPFLHSLAKDARCTDEYLRRWRVLALCHLI